MAPLKAFLAKLNIRHYVLLALSAVLVAASQLPEFAAHADALQAVAGAAAVAAGVHAHVTGGAK